MKEINWMIFVILLPLSQTTVSFSFLSLRPEPSQYHGIGSIQITCTGVGDNFTRVHWIRTNENGKNVTLNTTTLDLSFPGIWQAQLNYKPVNRTMTYTYYCVAKNKCCAKIISSPVPIPYIPLNRCPSPFNYKKPVRMTALASKRSVEFSWSYDPDPEDIGFTFQVTNITPEKRLNITTREITVHGLAPNQRYNFRYQVIFTIASGEECKTLPFGNSFTTQADIPSAPRNVTVITKDNALNVFWQRPKYKNSNNVHYIIFWRRTGSNKEYEQTNVTSSPYLIKDLTWNTMYNVKLYAANHIGISNSSEEISAITQKAPFSVHSLTSHLSEYHGFGLIKLLCTGVGDSFTRVHWIRTNENGKNVTLNTTTLELNNAGIWQAHLDYKPVNRTMTYIYYCVAENECCGTRISLPLRIPYSLPTSCPNISESKPVGMAAVPNKRSVQFSWSYDPDPEDIGFTLRVINIAAENRLNITTREFTVHGLVPYESYDFGYQVIFTIPSGKECKTILARNSFTTVAQVPSAPRNVTVIVKDNTLNVFWQRPKYEYSKNIHYIIFWRRTGSNKKYERTNVTSNYYLIKDLTGYTSYIVKVFAANHIGIGNSSEEISTMTLKGPGPYIRIKEITSTLESSNYTGFGRVAISCMGEGNNATRVSWIRTEKDGENDTLHAKMNAVTYTKGNPGQWKADLFDRPETDDFPHKYICVVENDCCQTKVSSPLVINYAPEPDGACPSSGVIKPIQVEMVPNKTTVKFTWTYDRDPEDNGFSFKVGRASPIYIFDVTAREYTIPDLEPETTYNYSINILYGKDCELLAKTGQFVTLLDFKTQAGTTSQPHTETNTGAVAGAVVGVILLLILVIIILYLIRKRIHKKEREKLVRKFHETIPSPENPSSNENIVTSREEPLPEKIELSEEVSYIELLEEWEIAPGKLTLLDKKLGGGQFGIVKQGLLTGGKGDPEVVAVKTLKDNAKESDLQDLLAELKILKEVNKVPHPNVMKLIGGCSIEGKLHLVMEFCPGGNLRSLLVKSRVYPSEESSSNYINLASTLNHRQLLKIAADVANGMAHLTVQKLVHRDLAARNILIGDDDMAKVSDFGLARDVGGAEEYIRNNQNLLPVKWMALESLLHGRFTTASDVWSYGVLLHEITTLGEEPYKNISPYNIVSHVGSGCRLPQPPQCADEVYDIMKNCWKVEPTDRPTFKEIEESLQSMLMDTEKSYINITHIVDEGPLTEETEGADLSTKDEAMRYTTTF